MTKFKSLREKARLTQEEVSRALDIDRTTVTKWETGDSFPRSDKLPILAALYGCTIDEMFQDCPSRKSITHEEAG